MARAIVPLALIGLAVVGPFAQSSDIETEFKYGSIGT
jgi:hypothetical protein